MQDRRVSIMIMTKIEGGYTVRWIWAAILT